VLHYDIFYLLADEFSHLWLNFLELRADFLTWGSNLPCWDDFLICLVSFPVKRPSSIMLGRVLACWMKSLLVG
jgi:hypothetical protein